MHDGIGAPEKWAPTLKSPPLLNICFSFGSLYILSWLISLSLIHLLPILIDYIRLYHTAVILDWCQILLTSMRGHSCKIQLSAIEETKRSSAIMWKSDQCCMPQCQNNRSKNIPNLTFLQFLSDESIWKQFLGKVVGLLRSLRRCI